MSYTVSKDEAMSYYSKYFNIHCTFRDGGANFRVAANAATMEEVTVPEVDADIKRDDLIMKYLRILGK